MCNNRDNLRLCCCCSFCVTWYNDTSVVLEVGYLPNNSLCTGANGLKILVTFEDGETSVADLDGVEVWVARGGRHGASRRRVGHGPPRLKNQEHT